MKFFNRVCPSLFRKKQIFDDISGYEDEKWLLNQVLNSEEPAHVLLVGPPGLGKTRFLKAIEKHYPDLSYFALASGSTGAGMMNQLFENPPRFLLIDEINDLRPSDQVILLSLMQDGVLVETKVSRTRRLEFTCSIIATCDDTRKLKEPLLSRFAIIELRGYNEEEFRKVALDVIKNHPLAEYIITEVYNSSISNNKEPNIRDCVRVAKLAQTEQDVFRILRMIKKR
jgi:MoxR-like ATPase